MSKVRKSIALGFMLLLSAAGATAQDEQSNQASTLRVRAEALVVAKPNQVQIDVGVLTQAATAEAATVENARRVEATMSQIRQILGSAGQIKTIGYNVSPVYKYPKEGGSPSISGFTATNTIQVTTGDLSLVGELIDAATTAGANKIQRLQFTLKDDQAAQIQALREASAKAKEKAEAMASALGLKVVRILSAEEEGGVVQPIAERSFAMARAEAPGVQTPVEPGTIDVRAVVTILVEVKSP